MLTYERIQEIREESLGKVQLRLLDISHDEYIDESIKHDKHHILICGGTGCHSCKSEDLAKEFHKVIKEKGLDEDMKVVFTGCFGLCESGPNVVIYPEGVFYSHLTVADIDRIVEEHIIGGQICRDLLFKEALVDKRVKPVGEVSFYKHQTRVALRHCGLIAPEDIDEYIALGGYEQLAKMIHEQTPKDEIIQTIIDSKLRGRGGAGFPTGIKWKGAYENDADQKYVICNGDEGDPGAFMDRSILEGDPHSVLEAMAICGYCIGASKGYIYIRAEYPIAVDRLRIAIKQAESLGILGENILGSDFSFDIELRLGAGAFVCGEGTALMESMEGKRGMPRVKLERSTKKGLYEKPTVLNNVETFANIPVILEKGADWFRSIGTEDSPGTKVFALGGKINNTGLIEIPMGVDLNTIIYDIGGGVPNGRKFKAIQTGGPSGGCIPAEYLDTPVDFENLDKLGSIIGSGGLVVMDDTDCMVDIAKFFMDFTVDESCGKCTPCRIGNKRVLEILNRITEGTGTEDDLRELALLSDVISDTSLCGLGKTATNPVKSTMKYFYDEYLAHVRDKNCPAGACKSLLNYFIESKCIGCTKCKRICPVEAISGKVKERHTIDTAKCIKCGACMDACPVNAIELV